MIYIVPKNVANEGKTEIFPGIGFIEIVSIVLGLILGIGISFMTSNIIAKIVIVALITFVIGMTTYGTTKGASLLLMLIRMKNYYKGQQRFSYKVVK